MESLTIVGSALTIIASLVGGGIWLMKVAFKLSQQNLQSRKELYAARIDGLKNVTHSLEDKLERVEKDLDSAMTRLETVAENLEETKNIMVSYVDSADEKVKSFEKKLEKLSNDLIIVKSKIKGNFL